MLYFLRVFSNLFFSALVRDDSKLLVAQKVQTKANITLFSSSGKQLAQFQQDKGRIVGMGWTDSEQLVCVIDDGTVRLYSFRREVKSFSLGKIAKDHGVQDVRIWGTGLVALTGNFTFIYTTFDEPRPAPLSEWSTRLFFVKQQLTMMRRSE